MKTSEAFLDLRARFFDEEYSDAEEMRDAAHHALICGKITADEYERLVTLAAGY